MNRIHILGFLSLNFHRLLRFLWLMDDKTLMVILLSLENLLLKKSARKNGLNLFERFIKSVPGVYKMSS